MPKLHIFVPCERALVDDLEKQVSLINILESLTVNLGESLPEDAAVPMRWMAFAFWRMEEGEEGKELEQRVRVISPKGETYVDSTVRFTLKRLNHRVRQRFMGFRVGEAGDNIVKLSIREVGNEEWSDVAEYPVHILHAPPVESTSEVASEDPAAEAAGPADAAVEAR